MEKYGLTPTELFVVKVLYLYKENYPEAYIIRYLNIPDNKKTFRDTLVSLQNKGVILKSYKIPNAGDEFQPDEVEFNKNFDKTFCRSAFDMGKDLFDHYPMFGTINGNTVSLRGVSKKFDSLEDFFRFYGKEIKWDPDLHQEILDLIDWEQNNNVGYICFSLATFVIEHKWEELKALKEGKIANINFNAIKQL
jgi:hypothetical protein